MLLSEQHLHFRDLALSRRGRGQQFSQLDSFIVETPSYDTGQGDQRILGCSRGVIPKIKPPSMIGDWVGEGDSYFHACPEVSCG